MFGEKAKYLGYTKTPEDGAAFMNMDPPVNSCRDEVWKSTDDESKGDIDIRLRPVITKQNVEEPHEEDVRLYSLIDAGNDSRVSTLQPVRTTSHVSTA